MKSKYLSKIKFNSEAIEQDDYDLVYYATEDETVHYTWRPYFMVWDNKGNHTKRQFHVSAITQSMVTQLGNASDVTNVRIPRTAISIESGAFTDCENLTQIKLTERITNIGTSAFASCTSLAEITIPSGVTSIGDGAFYGCSSLSKITYNGTITDWGLISIGTSAFSSIKATVINCSDGTVPLT